MIVFSHGLGGSRDGYAYIGRHWASRGYVSVHLQHKGSDTSVWKDKLQPMEAMRRRRRPRNSVDRVADARFAIDQLTNLNVKRPGARAARSDARRHGRPFVRAWTTLAVAGEAFIAPGGRQNRDGRSALKAAIAMSAPVPRNQEQLDKAFAEIRIPCLHMTGTLDDSPIGETKAHQRRLPFDHIRGPTST